MNDYFEHLEQDLRAVVRERRHLRWSSRLPLGHSGTRRRFVGRRPLAILAAAAMAAVVLLGVFGSGGSPTGPSSAAAADLVRLARVIETQPLTPHRGQYLFIESSSKTLEVGGDCRTWAIERRQLWVAADGSGLERDSSGPRHFTSAASRAACMKIPAAMRFAHNGHSYSMDTWYGAACLPFEPTRNWGDLSTDPHVLLRQMRRIEAGGPRTAAEDFVRVGDFLRDTAAPPRIRAAIYRAASLIPGIKSLGSVHTHDGRAGVGFAYTAHGSTSELIFDPHTGQLLGEQSTGDLNYWEDYQPERIVNHLPDNTTAHKAPSCHAGPGN